MRILLVTAYFQPHVGGVERFVEVLAGGLGARGHDVTVLCCRTEPGSPLAEEGDGYAIRRVPATNAAERRLRVPYPLPDLRRLRGVLAELVASADVVHVQDALYATSQAALLVASRRRRPLLVTQHVGFVPQANAVLDAAQGLAVRAAGPALRRAGRVVSYNPAVAEWARRTWRLGQVDVLPSGVALPPGAAGRAELGLPADRFVALFVGRDVPKKGLRYVLDAVDPAYQLVAVTDAAVVSRPGLDVRPFMPPARLAALLRSVDALVLPSSDEGIPLVIQEAALAGVPIVTAAAPGYDHYFAPGDLVLVDRDGASIRSALRALAADPPERTRLSERVRAVAERHFGQAAFVDAYEAAYRALL